jgi:hypothetical protein
MAALFEVHRAVNLKDRYLFGLVGVIEEGMVHTGMEASLTDDEDAPKFEGKVHGVEFVGAEGIIPEPTLTFHYRDPEKLERWESIDWEGKKLRLEWSLH